MSLGLLTGCAARMMLRGENEELAPSDLQQTISALPGDEFTTPAHLEDLSTPPAATPPPSTMPIVSSNERIAVAAKTSEQHAPPKVPTKKPSKKDLAKSTPPTVKEIPAPPVQTWSPKAWPFGENEKVVWAIRYGLIEGGIATLSVEAPKKLENEPVLHYRGQLRSSRMLEFFYKIDNTIDTWVRLSDHLPLRQEIRQQESSRRGQRIVVFNQKKNTAKFFSDVTKADGKKERILREDPMTPYAQDIFSSIFFVRFADLSKAVNFPIYDRWKNWNNELSLIGEEKVKLPAGQFDTLHFKMRPRVSGALKPKGDVDVWVWKHPSQLIVKFRANIKVGAITGEMRSYEGAKSFTLPLPKMKTPVGVPVQGALGTR